jgi:hypothetical protein
MTKRFSFEGLLDDTPENRELTLDICAELLLDVKAKGVKKNLQAYADWIDSNRRGHEPTRSPASLMHVFVPSLASQAGIDQEGMFEDVKGRIAMAVGGNLFTKKHYVSIGAAIGRAIQAITKATPPEKLEDTLAGLGSIVTELTNTFKEDNSRFKRDDFLKCITTKPTGPQPK